MLSHGNWYSFDFAQTFFHRQNVCAKSKEHLNLREQTKQMSVTCSLRFGNTFFVDIFALRLPGTDLSLPLMNIVRC